MVRLGRSPQPQLRFAVLVLDEEPIYREGVERAIAERPDLISTGTGNRIGDPLTQVRESRPDVVVVDAQLGAIGLRELLRALLREDTGLEVLVTSGSPSGRVIHDAFMLGARGFVSKRTTRAQLGDAIAAVAHGSTVLSPDLSSALAEEVRTRAGEQHLTLTERERQVLALAAQGHSSRAIANQMHISDSTIKSHLTHLYRKLGTSNRAGAVAEALRRRLI
jgi:two-component system nitrate/nitrite response regulator NarL